MYPNHLDVMQWLADSNLLEMIVDKLSPSVSTIFESCLDPLGFAANDWNMGSILSRDTSDCFSLYYIKTWICWFSMLLLKIAYL